MFKETLKRLFERRPSRSDQLQVAAKKWARSELGDTDAAAALANETRDFAAKLVDTEIHHWPSRDDFVNDRAYRLLVGVRDGAVPPTDSSKRERFAREEELGRLPLSEAFQLLAASYPELNGLEMRARDGEKISLRQRPMLKRILDEQDREGQTDTGFRMVWIYLRAVARGEDTEVSLFNRPGYRAHGGPFNRAAKLRLASIIAPLTFALVWCLTHGQTVGAVLVAVIWTFYVMIGLASLMLWRRQRTAGSSDEQPSIEPKP